jgi:hypothetical protein
MQGGEEKTPSRLAPTLTAIGRRIILAGKERQGQKRIRTISRPVVDDVAANAVLRIFDLYDHEHRQLLKEGGLPVIISIGSSATKLTSACSNTIFVNVTVGGTDNGFGILSTDNCSRDFRSGPEETS